MFSLIFIITEMVIKCNLAYSIYVCSSQSSTRNCFCLACICLTTSCYITDGKFRASTKIQINVLDCRNNLGTGKKTKAQAKNTKKQTCSGL